MIDIILRLLALALTIATANAGSPAEPEPIELIAPIVPCTTDAECYELNPHIPEPGHEEPVPSVGEGLGSLGYQPCENEDGPGPCYWDAQVRGNGEGRSYVIDSLGGVIYLY